jgi:ABC-type nitrate/sulfonate/bicarbonate transport system ATPase subunit
MTRDAQAGNPRNDAPIPSEAILRLQDVTKTFRIKKSHKNVLEKCSVDVQAGEFVSLLGPSGCGKSTLLNMLAGFDFPDTGSATFHGSRIAGPSPRRVMCFQDSLQALLPWRTVRGNVDFALARTGADSATRSRRATELLTMVGLDAHQDSIPPQLSGGMRQKLQLARALAVDPDVLLMDEPFGALDAITRAQMQRELLRIWAGTHKSVVFVTHDVNEAVLLSDRIHVMSKGPQAQIKETFEVDIPRERDVSTKEFVTLVDKVSRALEGNHRA